MASVDLEYNQGFKIYKGNTWFNNLVLHKATYETVVMSLGDKISGIVYYKNNKLVVDMTEYIMYKDVKYVLVNPPTVIKEGLVSDNGELKGMTKYSFTFYHPMYMLSNFPFSDVAVDNSQKQYLSQNKTFSWIGNLTDYVAKLNENLEGTQWKVLIGTNVTNAEKNKLSEVLTFDNNTIADALKTAYETWEIPYIVDKVEAGTQDYIINEKRFIVQFGLPSNEIYEVDEEGEYILDDNNEKIPFVFKYGQGVGLKNNSRTPKNNKIVTRIAGYGSEDNIPYGYPQIVWTGESSWNYTINNASGMQTITVGGRTIQTMSYPIYDGIVGGQKVRLIKHPFTRTHLMPPIYSETVNKKVNPNATGYDPDTELVDYYDADDNTYPNQIKAGEPSYEMHEFEDIKPEFGSFSINSATPYDGHSDESITQNKFLSIVDDLYTETDIKAEKTQLNALRTSFVTQQQNSAKGTSGNYEYDWSFKTDGQYKKVKYVSSGANFEYVVNVGLTPATIDWDDTMDEQGNYVQSYFKVTLPALGFDLYASAAITQEMTINMRSGACIGCSFPVMVDWDDYKRNFYDKDGNFAPTGTQRNYTKYPNSTNASITLILQKETNTFGTLMPNIYQKPASGDKFVILGISLPTSYITTAEGKLETEMKKYMRDNNVYYYEYPLKFDEHFLISNEHILSQMKPNVIVKFEYADVEQSLYIKQMSIKYNESPLPKYDITLTDDVDVVLNKIGEAIAEYRGQRQYENGGGNSETLDGNKFLRKDINDTASGTIRMLKGLQVGERFVTGLLGEGGIFRKDDDGTTYLECDRMYVRMKAYFDTVEVRRFLHSGGNRIASAAGMKCSRVEYIASNGSATRNVSDAVKFRCYFRAEDNGAKVTNDFVVGDLAYCKETNIDTNLSQHGYWRAVVGVSSNANSSGEHWIDLSKSDCSPTLNDVPIAQDDIIQLGNKTAKARQGAIVEYVSGEDAPSYQIYQGINTYNLANKNYIGLGYSSNTGRAYMNVYGDFLFGDKAESTYIKYNAGTKKLEIKADVKFKNPDAPTQDTTLEDFASAVTDDIDNLQSQIDGQIETWFYDYDPTVVNAPASDWTTVSEKNNHLGDLFYNTTSGYAWRWGREETAPNVYEYKWYRITDVDVVKALADAAKAQDTADHKRRVFVAQPIPPYDEGDLWVNATYVDQTTQETVYDDDILKCITPKAEGGSFSINDWELASKYTDDTRFESFISQIIDGTGASGNDAIVANAISAVTDAINEDDTEISGGLVLTSLIGLRSNSQVWAGISGLYKIAETGTGYKGHGIAAWYGGRYADWEVYLDTLTQEQRQHATITDAYAKSLFRFDGSGYLAGGNITWDAQGRVAIKDITTLVGGNNTDILNALTTFNNAFLFTTAQGSSTILNINPQYAFSHLEIYDVNGNHAVATTDYVNENFVTKAFFNRLFQAYSSTTTTDANKVSPNEVTAIDNLKILVGAWTDQYLSAKGLNSQSSGGGGIGDVTWDLLASNSDTHQIAASHLNVLNGYATQSWVTSQISGNVSRIDVGTTQYSPSGGVVTLPAYPTTLPIVSSFNFLVNRLQYLQVYNNEGASVEVNDAPTSLYWHIIRTVRNDAHKYYTDIAIPFTDYTKGIHYKVINNNTLVNNGWVRLLDTINYTDYTVSKTGGGASGTWGISISGTAADSDKLGGYGISRMVFDIGSSFGSNDKIYDIGSKKVFSGNNMPDAPVTGWVSGIVLGSNWNDNHYQNYLVESGNGRWYTTRHYTNGSMDEWKTFAYLTDNVASATKLQTARTLWGQSFDGTANVTGAMSSVTSIDDVLYFYFGTTAYRIGIGTNEPEAKLHVVGNSKLMGNITMNGAITGLTNIDGLVYIDNAKVGIGVVSPTSKLHVSGNVTANNYIAGTASGSYIQIGAIRIEYEQSTQSLKVYHTTSGTNANLYATGAVSALGSNSQSGGGGIGDVTWDALAGAGNQQINISHLSSAGVATQSWVRSQFGGTITRVDVGTGQYLPSNGVVSLPAYPTTLPASDVSAWAKADTKPTYAFNEITGSLTEADIPSLSWSKITTGKPTSWWGASVDANGAVKGSMSNVDDIAFSASGKKVGGFAYFYTGNSKQLKLTSGSSSDVSTYTCGYTYTPMLYVDGNIAATGEAYMKGIKLAGYNASPNSNHHGGYIDFHYQASTDDFTTRIIESANGVLSIMKSSGATGLVVGTPTTNDYIKIGGATLTWDGSALKIDTGFYSESFISALGTGSGSGGGGVGDVTWDALATTATGGRTIDSSYISGFLSDNGGIVYGNVSVNGYVDADYLYAQECAKLGNICVECYSNGSFSNGGYIHEINDFTAALNLNYSTTNSVTVCQGKIVFKHQNGWSYIETDNPNDDDLEIHVNQLYVRTEDGFFGNNSYNLSDIRLKDIIDYPSAPLEMIANAPIFNFRWKDGRNKHEHLGTSAQYWEDRFAKATRTMANGYLAMDYGATALAAAVFTARKVLEHEGRIRLLEIENQALRKEIEQLKKAA